MPISASLRPRLTGLIALARSRVTSAVIRLISPFCDVMMLCARFWTYASWPGSGDLGHVDGRHVMNDHAVEVGAIDSVAVLMSLDPAATQFSDGDLRAPGAPLRVRGAQAMRGERVWARARRPIAVTHLLNGVPVEPETRFLLWFWQSLP